VYPLPLRRRPFFLNNLRRTFTVPPQKLDFESECLLAPPQGKLWDSILLTPHRPFLLKAIRPCLLRVRTYSPSFRRLFATSPAGVRIQYPALLLRKSSHTQNMRSGRNPSTVCLVAAFRRQRTIVEPLPSYNFFTSGRSTLMRQPPFNHIPSVEFPSFVARRLFP